MEKELHEAKEIMLDLHSLLGEAQLAMERGEWPTVQRCLRELAAEAGSIRIGVFEALRRGHTARDVIHGAILGAANRSRAKTP